MNLYGYGLYPPENRELESAMHLAACWKTALQPLQNGTGILFAKAEFNEAPLCGTTRGSHGCSA